MPSGVVEDDYKSIEGNERSPSNQVLSQDESQFLSAKWYVLNYTLKSRISESSESCFMLLLETIRHHETQTDKADTLLVVILFSFCFKPSDHKIYYHYFHLFICLFVFIHWTVKTSPKKLSGAESNSRAFTTKGITIIS